MEYMTKKHVPWLLDWRSQDKLHNIVGQNKSSWFQNKQHSCSLKSHSGLRNYFKDFKPLSKLIEEYSANVLVRNTVLMC